MAPNVWDVLSESKRIINSQLHHYLTLSIIFLLPISFLSLISQLIIKHLQQQQPPINPTTIIFLSLLFLISSSIFSYSAIITITYSVYNAFFNRPIKLKEAIKSISTYFFPILATDTVIATIFLFAFFLFTLLIGVVSFLITYLGGVNLKSYSYLIVLLSTVSMLVFMTYLAVNLSLVKVIVVVESSWGLEPLKRSWKLVKGMRKLVLSIIFLFGSLQGILLWLSGYNLVLVFIISPINAMILLYNIAVYTVIYIYCNEKHGEVEDEEFRKEKDEANLSLIPS